MGKDKPMAGSVSLREFGFNFCGPLLWTYTQHVAKYLEKNKSRVYCLAREGYLFKKALEVVEPQASSVYLYASRTFLFRISLHDQDSWQFSLTHGFEGSLKSFLTSRFGFTLNEAELILEGTANNGKISLPSDIDDVKSLLETKKVLISSITESSRNAYLAYLASLGLSTESERPVLFLDIGYSGTIQKLLTLLLNRNTSGYYFVTTNSSNNKVNNLIAEQHYTFRNGVKMGQGYDLLDRSMFLESLFTSPDGQFIDIRHKNSETEPFEFYFGKRGYTQKHFEKLKLVFNGTLEAVQHFNQNNISFSSAELDALYSKYVFHKNLIPSESWPLFEFDDAISGNGNVNPLSFFGL